MTGQQPAANAAVALRNALRLRYPERAYALLFEVAERTGAAAGSFADAVAVGLWPSHGLTVDGFMIKATREQWLLHCETADSNPPVHQFCDQWWLVADKGVSKVSELPAHWGLLEFDGSVLRKRKDPAKLDPQPLTREFLAMMLRRHAGLDEAMSRAVIEALTEKSRAEIQVRADAAVESMVGTRVRAAEDGLRKLAEIKDKTGVDLLTLTPANEWVAAMAFLAANPDWSSRFTASGLKDLREQAAQLVAEIDAFSRGQARTT